MGDVVDIKRYASGRDRKLLTDIVQAAQLAQAYATYDRSYFLSSPDDQRKISERLVEMGQDAGRLSSALRQRTPQIPWAALIEAGAKAGGPEADPKELWTAVKRVVPRVTAELAPLLGESASVFTWTPPPKQKRTSKANPASKRARSRERR
ncbi:MAG: hypothetical protein AUH85_01780 [Chloroflexi bacterium 13_1_40CM_4_68_4]|nr:MAG: hypothetical protein AUH85_01780 [Chloroflexi bacterium 13_1_40CM_4_68_4]